MHDMHDLQHGGDAYLTRSQKYVLFRSHFPLLHGAKCTRKCRVQYGGHDSKKDGARASRTGRSAHITYVGVDINNQRALPTVAAKLDLALV